MVAVHDVLILDNGAYTVKVGTSRDEEPRIVPNCIFKAKSEKKRVFVGSEIDDCADKSGIYYTYSCEKGYTVNYDVQQQIWDRALADYLPHARNSKLVMTDLNYLIPAIKDQSLEIIFEEFEFGKLHKSSAPAFSSMSSTSAALVIDCGFSCTTVSAFFDGKPLKNATIRIDVGGKLLTNQLKDWISFREINVMEETYVVNECKEDCCFVSLNPEKDLGIARLGFGKNTIRRDYVLPDFSDLMRGYIRGEDEQVEGAKIKMNLERFMLPEALFSPSNLLIEQMGVAEAAAEVISHCPPNMRYSLASNIVVTGGSTKFPNFTERLKIELDSMLGEYIASEFLPVSDPLTHAWKNAREAAKRDQLEFVSRAEYAEHGTEAISKRFLNFVDN